MRNPRVRCAFRTKKSCETERFRVPADGCGDWLPPGHIWSDTPLNSDNSASSTARTTDVVDTGVSPGVGAAVKNRLAFLACWGLMFGLAGCQCCQLTECYQDKIDCIADHKLNLDRYYHPTWDLTRIGYPDWCAGPINHWCYGCCCRCCREHPAYDHMPIYVASQEDPARHPDIPSVPPLSPNAEAKPIDPSESIGPAINPTPRDLNKPAVIPDPKALDLSQPPQAPPLEFPRQPGAAEFPEPQKAQPMVPPGAYRETLIVPLSHQQAEGEADGVQKVAAEVKAAEFPASDWMSKAKPAKAPEVKSAPRFAPPKDAAAMKP